MSKVREGYKETEIGIIPEDWTHEKLKNLCTKITDGAHKTPTYIKDGIPFLRVTDIQTREINWNNVKYISVEEHKELIKRCNPEVGDILYSKNGTIGIPKIIDWNREFSIFVSLCLIKVKTNGVNKKFLEQFLKSDNCLNQIKLRAKQGTVTNLHLEEIRELDIALPSCDEQHRIAEILSTTDAHIEKLDKTIEDYQLLKKGMMKKLLTEGIGHTEFKDTEIGRIPKEWDVIKLKSLCSKITDGTHKTPKYTNEGVPFLRVSDIHSKRIDWSAVKYISREEHLELIKRCNPEIGDILYSKNGTIGIPKIIDWTEEFSIFVSLCLIKIKDGAVDKKFLEQFLKSDNCLDQIRLRAKQGTVTNLHLEEIRELNIPFPSNEEQMQIANILDAIDIMNDLKMKEREDFSELKKGLMEKLLTGRIRVCCDENTNTNS